MKFSKIDWKPTLPPFRKHKKDLYAKIIAVGQFIYQIGETPALRESSKSVEIKEIKTPLFQKKVAYLKKCLFKYRKLTGVGRGITAIQVGIPQNFSVIYIPEGKGSLPVDKNGLLIIINPKITKESKKLLRYPEMCMSANPIIAPTVRPSWIEFEYDDEKGIKRYWNRKDEDKQGKMYNRVFQHEIDHMEGIINIDKLNSKDLFFESDPEFYEKAGFEEI